jgi:hypothetical protein
MFNVYLNLKNFILIKPLGKAAYHPPDPISFFPRPLGKEASV